jgi:hypothetical protein
MMFGSAPPGGRGARRYPAAGVKGITVERSSNRVGVGATWRPPIAVIGIIGGMPVCAPAWTAERAPVPPNGAAAGVAPVQAVGTDNAPAVVAWPIPAETAGMLWPRPPKPDNVNVPAPAPIPADWAAPSSLAAVVAALAAVAVLPAVKSLDSMLIGIVAIRSGVLSSLSSDIDDDDEDDVSVAVDARPLRACGDDRLCRACGVLEINCGPEDMSVSRSVPPEVPTDWAAAATWPAGPLGLVVWGGEVNGLTCDAVAEAPAYPYIAEASWAHISA